MAFSFSLMCCVAQAALPPAPLNVSAAQEVVNEFRDHYEDDFRYDMSRVPKSVLPTPEQSYVYAKYMNKAFERAGYSLDETLYQFFKTGGVSGGTNANPNVLFVQKLNLTTYATFLKNDSTANAFLKAGAVSERTIAYAKSVAIETPIIDSDYVIEASEYPGTEKFKRESGRFVGYIKQGTGPWKDWLYFESEEHRGEQNGFGIAPLSAGDHDEMKILKALIGKRVKMEGAYFLANGVRVGVAPSVIVSPRFIDLSHKMIFKVL